MRETVEILPKPVPTLEDQRNGHLKDLHAIAGFFENGGVPDPDDEEFVEAILETIIECAQDALRLDVRLKREAAR